MKVAEAVVKTDEDLGVVSEATEEKWGVGPRTEAVQRLRFGGERELAALYAAAVCASDDYTRPVLNGVLLEGLDGGGVRVVSTNTYRLLQVDLPGAKWEVGGGPLLFPARAILKGLGSQARRREDRGCVLDVYDNREIGVCVNGGRGQAKWWRGLEDLDAMGGLVLEGQYVRWDRVMPEHVGAGAWSVDLEVGRYLSVLDAVGAAYEVHGGCWRIVHRVVVDDMDAWRLEVVAPKQDLADFDEAGGTHLTLSGSMDVHGGCGVGVGTSFEWALNGEYVSEVLGLLGPVTSWGVRLKHEGEALRPFEFVWEHADRPAPWARYVVMPMQVM